MFLCISSFGSIGQRLLSERKDFQGMEAKPTQTWDWASFSTRASHPLCQRLPLVFGVGYLCSTLSLSLGVRRLCLRGMVVKRNMFSKYNCTCGELTSISNGKHIVPRLFSKIWTSFYCMIALILSHVLCVTSLTCLCFWKTQVCVSSVFQSQQKHPRTTHDLGWRSVNKTMPPEHTVN